MADSVEHRHVNDFVLDVLSSGGRLLLNERPARAEEVGKPIGVIGQAMVLRAYRDGKPIGFWEPGGAAILAGDMLMALEVQAPGEAGNERG
jgi:voltage-gated potassium channel